MKLLTVVAKVIAKNECYGYEFFHLIINIIALSIGNEGYISPTPIITCLGILAPT